MDTDTLKPIVRQNGKDYASSVVAQVKAADATIKDAEFDLRVMLQNPNSKVSDDNRIVLKEFVDSIKETLRKIEQEAEL